MSAETPMQTAAGPPSAPVRMRDSDAFSWYMERDPLLRSTVVAVAVLDREPDWDALVERVRRAVHRLPILRIRLAHPPLRLAPPRWVEVADVDLDWHLQRAWVEKPRAWQAVLDLARRKAVTAFDPARPLWEMTVVSGLPDGGAALVMVFHHSLTDGIGGVQLAMELFDGERAPGPDDRPVWPDRPEDPSSLRLAWEGLDYDARGSAAFSAHCLARERAPCSPPCARRVRASPAPRARPGRSGAWWSRSTTRSRR